MTKHFTYTHKYNDYNVIYVLKLRLAISFKRGKDPLCPSLKLRTLTPVPNYKI